MISILLLKITFLVKFEVVSISLKFFRSLKKKLHRSGKNFTIVGKTSPPWEKLHRLLRSFLMKFFQPPCSSDFAKFCLSLWLARQWEINVAWYEVYLYHGLHGITDEIVTYHNNCSNLLCVLQLNFCSKLLITRIIVKRAMNWVVSSWKAQIQRKSVTAKCHFKQHFETPFFCKKLLIERGTFRKI